MPTKPEYDRAEFEPGATIASQFKVVRRIGRGGMGVVYEVTDALTQQRLALKVLFPAILSRPGAAEHFLQAADAVRQLRDPGIVTVYDVRQAGPLNFLTMELIEGQTLRQLLTAHRQLSLGKAAGLIHRVCRALEYAHKTTVHGNLCPENVMVLPDASVCVLDFGIGRALDWASPSGPFLPVKTAFYTAPELLYNAQDMDVRSDVYALGVLFFEMLTGQVPCGYNRIRFLRPDVPKECDQVVSRALATREKRYPSAREFRKFVEACYAIQQKAESTGEVKPKPDAGPKPLTPPPKEPPRPVPAKKPGQPSGLVQQENEWERWEQYIDVLRGGGGASPEEVVHEAPGGALRKWLKKDHEEGTE
jgi:serine/threonine protein kinase